MSRWMPRIVLCLLLGAATGLALTWVIAAWVPVAPTQTEVHDGASHSFFMHSGVHIIERSERTGANWKAVDAILRWENFGRTRLYWVRDALHFEPQPSFPPGMLIRKQAGGNQGTYTIDVRGFLPLMIVRSNPYWWSQIETTQLTAEEVDALPTTSFTLEDAYGWPFHAAACSVDLAALAQVSRATAKDAIVLPPVVARSSGMHCGSYRALPLRPLLPGVLLNALFFGTVWFVLLLMLDGVRALRRSRRKQCPQCGYDLRYQVQGDERESSERGCPECGWNRRERAAAGDSRA